MNFKTLIGAGLAAGALTVTSISGAGAAVVVDTDTGYGFVGKGDVQYTFGGQNNSWLQRNAANIQFRYVATEVTEQETTWTCDRDAGPQTQERENTTTSTTSINAVATTIARDGKKQITGFNLNGYSSTVGGTPVVEREGPAIGSCPTGWTAINQVTGDLVVVSSTGGLEVTATPTPGPFVWVALLEAPAPAPVV